MLVVNDGRLVLGKAMQVRLKLVGVGIVGALALMGCATASPGVSTRPVSLPDLVLAAARTTLAERTADITLTGTMTVAGRDIQMSGTGVGDLANNNLKMTIKTALAGTDATIEELFVHSRLYLAFSTAGHSFRELTGRDWLAMPAAPTSGVDLSGGNPLQALNSLAQQGSTVTSLGQSNIGGITVDGYSVTPSRAAMIAAANKYLSSPDIPADVRAAALHTIQTSPVPTFKVWFDHADELMRRMTTSMGLNLPTGSGSGSVVMDFTHYGVPVNVSAPPANDVLSYQQFLQHLNH